MTDDEKRMQQALELEALIDAARLLGVTQAKRGFGCYTQEDARFEQAMHEAVQRHRTALRERLAQPEEHTARVITDAHGRKHITNEPRLRG